MPYFLHRVLVAGLAKEWFGIKLNDWWWYAFANARPSWADGRNSPRR